MALGGEAPTCQAPANNVLPAARAGEGRDLPAGTQREGGRGLLVRLRQGHLSSQSQGVTMPYNWASVCVMRPCNWDSSACLHPCCVPPEPCFAGDLGLHGGAGSLGWQALRSSQPTGRQLSSLVVKRQAQVAHLHPVLGSLCRRGQPCEALGGWLLLPAHLSSCLCSEPGWLSPEPGAAPLWGRWSQRAVLVQRTPT